MVFLATLLLVLRLSIQTGFEPLTVDVSVRLMPVHAGQICVIWTNETRPYEAVSCQPAIPPWALYQARLRLTCGAWNVQAFFEPPTGDRVVTPRQTLYVVSSPNARTPCEE